MSGIVRAIDQAGSAFVRRVFGSRTWPESAPNVLKHSNNEWRKHPYVTTTLSSALPGIQYGFVAAVIYEGGRALLGESHGVHQSHGPD